MIHQTINLQRKKVRHKRKRGTIRPINIMPYIKETLHSAADNRRLLILWLLFLSGMLAGANLCHITEGFFAQQCDNLFASWLAMNESRSFLAVLRSSLITNLAFAVTSTLMGLSAAGLPLIGCLPLLRGLGLGVLCGKLYSDFALHGLGSNLLLIIPGALVAILGLLLICKENFESAQAFGKAAKTKVFPNDWRGLREHLTHCAALLIFAVLGAVLDGATAVIFGGFFLT